MPIYWGRRKIKDRGDSGVFYGDRKIKFVYFGNRLVYSYESYDPGSVIVALENGQNLSMELLPGVYQLKIAGGGGNNANWAYEGYAWGASGGSGASVEGTFYLDVKKNIYCHSGASVDSSYIDFESARGVTAGNGGSASFGSIGSGGVGSIGTGFENLSLVSSNGNAGIMQPGVDAIGGASVSSKKWGCGRIVRSGEVQHGGIEIVYLRRWK